MSKPVLAKTNGITLRQHTQHVIDEAVRHLDAFPFLEEKYKEQTGEELRPQVVRAAMYHDQGKAAKPWQDACWADRGNQSGRNLMKVGMRHEIASLAWIDSKGIELTFPERAAIAAHHSKLSYRQKHRWIEDKEGRFKRYWKEFDNRARQWTLDPPPDLKQRALRERFRISGVRTMLRMADVRASIKEQEKWVPDLNDLQFNYDFPYDAPRGVQKAIKDGWDEPIMILRAPTGSGKTDASLLWAQHQIDEGRADRCVIAMPTRFTSNSLALDVDDSVSRSGLYHSSAWYARHKEKADQSREAKHRAQEQHRHARLLATPVTVSTIDHLLISLTGTREDHHNIFYHLCNSCVVIDEADFYDPFVQANLQELLEVLQLFDVPVLIMSATVPDAAKSFYSTEVLAEDTSDLTRTRCFIKDAGEAETPEDIQSVLEEAAQQPGAIIYANTVKRALAYYDWFCDHARQYGYAEKDVTLYHSRFTEPDKKRIENELIAALGAEAWENGTAGGIAVLTQIGEMSLNISAPLMMSELCPYDRLAQRAGRLSRFEDMPPGPLHVVTPTKDGELYPAPYGSYEQESRTWIPGRALLETKERLTETPHSAQDFIDAVDAIYDTPESFAPASERTDFNRKQLSDHLKHDWLIVNAQSPDEEESRTEEWMSRDIPPQETVLTVCPEGFNTYRDYQAFVQTNGVSVPAYQIEMGQRIGRAPNEQVHFHVSDDEESAWYTPVYSQSEGLILDMDRGRSVQDRCL